MCTWIAGKLCLQNEDIAKKVVAAMARELEVGRDFKTRNNIVFVLCDLCVRSASSHSLPPQIVYASLLDAMFLFAGTQGW